jgi:transposase
MGTVDTALLASLLLFPPGLSLASIQATPTCLTVQVCCTHPLAACPLCGHVSERVHGRYERTVADVPCAGRRVTLALTVRKFVCRTPTCPRRIFTERLPDLVPTYARMTPRLKAALQAIGLAAGGEQGSRLAEKVGIQTTPPTLLRHVMTFSAPTAPPVRVLGVDDWSWKKGRRYGTILVDLERHIIIDLLPDRSSATFARWLRAHPSVRIISRDRGTEYAAAARQAAPQALQIADRFHLVRNLVQALELLLARCAREPCPAPPERQPRQEAAGSPQRSFPHKSAWRQQPDAQAERRYHTRQAQREKRFEDVHALRSHGLSVAEIAKQVGKAERSVRSWLKQEAVPLHRRHRQRRSAFDPYAPYVLERWQAGVYDGKQLFGEIRAQGFAGTLRMVQRFLQPLRDHRRPVQDLAPPAPTASLGARSAVWLFIRDPAELTKAEHADLEQMRHASPMIEQIYGLVQGFLTLVRHRQGTRLEAWLEAVRASPFAELRQFARGLCKDKAAVLAGLTLDYSNGQTEAHVHKLKLVKRSMFGRAKLPLLKQRVLYRL